MVYAWPGLISARLAESPAGVCDTTQAFALSGSNVTALAPIHHRSDARYLLVPAVHDRSGGLR
jgi:hypothetical protein